MDFGTLWSDNRRIDDIIEPNHKPRFFYNHIPMNEFAEKMFLNLKECVACYPCCPVKTF
jgi:hypothetical protein